MYLGIDLGTSGIKAVVIDEVGGLVAQTSVPLTVSNPQPLWSEQDPEEWWQGLLLALGQLGQQIPLKSIRSMGLAGHMHGATLLDQDGKILRPCILWNDGRSYQECKELVERCPDLHERSGNLAMPGFTAPKVLWVAKHEPAIFVKIAKVLLPKDYLVWRLTGVFASDMSDAAGTLWLNPAMRSWDESLLAATGLTIYNMPQLFEGNEVVGRVSAEEVLDLGMEAISVVAGAGDNAAGAVGVGVIEPGQSFYSLGTSGVFFVVSDQHRANPENTVHAFCHCLPGRWHQMSVTLSAANSLAWFARLVNRPVAELLAEVEQSGRRTTNVLFLPYLSGERTPHNDPKASGCFFGATNNSDQIDFTLAVLEGVAYSSADGRDALVSAGSHFHGVTLIGGGARSALWRQILADVLQMTLTFRDGGEVGPGLGAARLAHLGLADINEPGLLQRVCTEPAVLQEHIPNTVMAQYHMEHLEKYRSLYKALKPIFAAS